MQGSPWYVDFFSDDYLDIYRHQFSDERAEKESAFIVEALQLQPGMRVLDLCCGQGRHAVAMAKRGLEVTGLDLNAAYLELTRRTAAANGTTIETVNADMRHIPFRKHFDAVVNMFSSFGYLESETEDLKVLEAVAGAIKPGGMFLLDMLNREWAVTNYIQNDWHRDGGDTLYVEHRELDLASSRMHVSFTIIGADGTRRDSSGHHIRLYTLTETTAALAQAGLNVTGVFGGFDGEPYSIATRRMIIRAQSNA